jgi:CheY-like chemotaxis protein
LPATETRLRRFTEGAMRGTERATALTNRLLAFARRQALEPKVFDVNELLSEMADLLRRTLGERIAVRMRLADGVGSVLADPNHLESAILNLVVNARDAMPDGGIVTIETSSKDLGPEPASGRYVLISVSDTGAGMAAHVKSRAFEPFFTTKQPGEGTGLGLPQVYGFIKQSGGLCLLESEIGKGTTVTMKLPVAGLSGASPETKEGRQTALTRGHGELILVTEDDPEVRAYSADILHELGYQVLAASDAEAALRILVENPGVRLLFTDFGLPGSLNGRQLAEVAIARHPGLKVLLTTGYADDAPTGTRMDAETELIAKPFTSAALSAKIKAVLYP